jgi:Kdo2-lipid IVA lauroyltransferase/acyltransferase
LKTLRGNAVLAMLIDQDSKRVPQVVVPFFGRPARTPSGAAALALRSGAALVPVYIERTDDGHRIEFEPPIDANAAVGDDAVTELTARLTRSIEARVRRHPEQWVWWHKRWRMDDRHAAGDTSAAPG